MTRRLLFSSSVLINSLGLMEILPGPGYEISLRALLNGKTFESGSGLNEIIRVPEGAGATP